MTFSLKDFLRTPLDEKVKEKKLTPEQQRAYEEDKKRKQEKLNRMLESDREFAKKKHELQEKRMKEREKAIEEKIDQEGRFKYMLEEEAKLEEKRTGKERKKLSRKIPKKAAKGGYIKKYANGGSVRAARF